MTKWLTFTLVLGWQAIIAAAAFLVQYPSPMPRSSTSICYHFSNHKNTALYSSFSTNQDNNDDDDDDDDTIPSEGWTTSRRKSHHHNNNDKKKMITTMINDNPVLQEASDMFHNWDAVMDDFFHKRMGNGQVFNGPRKYKPNSSLPQDYGSSSGDDDDGSGISRKESSSITRKSKLMEHHRRKFMEQEGELLP